MARLTFKSEDLKPIVEHALAADHCLAPYSEDEKTPAPALWLVGDRGVYLMSGGQPMQKRTDGEGAVVAYAAGIDPRNGDDWYDRKVATFGGDDGVECLPWAREIADAINAGAKTITVTISSKGIGLLAKVPATSAKETPTMKPTDDDAPHLTQIEVAKLTAKIEGGGFKRQKDRKRQIARFHSAAIQAGISEAHRSAILGAGNYASAAEALLVAMKPASKAKPKAVPKAEAAEPAGSRKRITTAALMEAAQRGEIPEPPDFSRPYRKSYRPKLAEIVAAVEARDVAALRQIEIPTYNGSMQAMARYRDAAIVAIEAGAK